MANPSTAATDALITKMEKRINKVYGTAKKELEEKLNIYLESFVADRAKKQADLAMGAISQSQYDSWVASKALTIKWKENMVKQMSMDMTLTDAKAMSIVRGYMPEAYAINRNYQLVQISNSAHMAVNFTLYDSATVQKLIDKKPTLLPQPSPNVPKEMQWHQTKITGAITQSILQGESIPQTAKRLQTIEAMDNRAAIRNARTAMTAAQNSGRVDAMEYASGLGIKLKKQWLATLDGRTRDSHRVLDGEVRELNEKFSNGLRYPADPNGDGSEIYNCRCTLVAAVDGIDQSGADRASKLDGLSYEDWKWQGDEIAKNTYGINETQRLIDKLPIKKKYAGIWVNPVKLSDYKSKLDSGSLQNKKDYYESRIARLEQQPYDSLEDWQKNLLAQYKQNYALLKEYEANGELYVKYQQQLAQYQKGLKLAQKQQSSFVSQLGADAYTDERKRNAALFSDRDAADKVLRPVLDSQWADLTDDERYAIWQYTNNSNPINKPLSGYTDTWQRRDFVGYGNTDWGREDSWRTNPSQFKRFGHSDGRVDYAHTISSLTTGIDKCELEQDMWFVRGSGTDGLAGLLEDASGNGLTFDEAMRILRSGDTARMQSAFIGYTGQNEAFTSTAIATGSGFGGEVRYKIYAPKGTHAVYAEPQSHYGLSSGGNDRLYNVGDSYYGVGGEAEVIFQRGTQYRITDIEYNYGQYEVTMEVVAQPDYFATGYEQTYNGGATSFK